MRALSGDFLDKFDLARLTSLDVVTPNRIFNSGTAAAARR
jgi:hypothetical protein